jgi:hypothetical protein
MQGVENDKDLKGMGPRAIEDIFMKFKGKMLDESKDNSSSGDDSDGSQEEPSTPLKKVAKQANIFVSIQ